MAGYCGRHGIDHSSSDCPRCLAEERHEELLSSNAETVRVLENLREESIQALEESDRRRANPGDFECPHCRYISLRRDASRCPLCHGSIDSGYWKVVLERERARKEAARVAAEARALAERQKQEELEKARKEKAAADGLLGLIAFGLLLICVGVAFVITRNGARAIRGHDFRNFAYDLSGTECAEWVLANELTVHDGSSAPPVYQKRGQLRVSFVAYGDLAGGAKEEAVVGIDCYNPGTTASGAPLQGALIYAIDGKEILRIGVVPGGSRSLRGIPRPEDCDSCSDPFRVEGRALFVLRMAGGGMCCPQDVVEEEYRIRRNTLELVNSRRVDAYRRGNSGQ